MYVYSVSLEDGMGRSWIRTFLKREKVKKERKIDDGRKLWTTSRDRDRVSK